jgi:arylsulfatase A-like enzyme
VRPDRRIVALYDLRNDPNEDRNLAADPAHAAALKAMHQRLLDVMTADRDPTCAEYAAP